MGDVLPHIIRDHLQFTDRVNNEAKGVVKAALSKRSLDNHVMVGVHVRRTDYNAYSKWFIPELLNETYFLEAMKYMRDRSIPYSTALLPGERYRLHLDMEARVSCNFVPPDCGQIRRFLGKAALCKGRAQIDNEDNCNR